MKKLKIGIILGTRPEIIKMSPIIKELQRRKLKFFIIHTGQHYSYNMDKIFLDELDLPLANYNLEVGSCTHGVQTALMLGKIEKILIKEQPSAVLVQGDTNSVLSGALAASKLNIEIGHVEAGLRSYFRQMPEEINRVIADHVSRYLFVPTKEAKKNLLKEGILKKDIFITGNTVVDSVLENIKVAEKKSTILKKLNIKKSEYFLATIHRAENTDSKQILVNILRGLLQMTVQHDLPIIWPIHPRTKGRLESFGLNRLTESSTKIRIIEPVGFLDFLMLEANAKLIMTDSGGIQEESCILNVPCLTLRDNTERPETVSVGANILVGTNPEKILSASNKILNSKKVWKNPFGDGKAAQKVINILRQSSQRN